MVTYNVNVEVLENAHTLYVASEPMNSVTCTCMS